MKKSIETIYGTEVRVVPECSFHDCTGCIFKDSLTPEGCSDKEFQCTGRNAIAISPDEEAYKKYLATRARVRMVRETE